MLRVGGVSLYWGRAEHVFADADHSLPDHSPRLSLNLDLSPGQMAQLDESWKVCELLSPR